MLRWLPVYLVPTLVYPPFVLAFVVPGRVSLWIFNLAMLLCVGVIYLVDKKTDVSNATWGEGARGEFRVGEELEKLHKEGFHVFHDWHPEGRGNVDHFIIGPQGVFAIETKAWAGEITCENGKLLVNGRPPDKDPVVQVKGEAADVSRLIEASRGLQIWVHPILCSSRAELRCYEDVGVQVTNTGPYPIFSNGTLVSVPRRSRDCLHRIPGGCGKRSDP